MTYIAKIMKDVYTHKYVQGLRNTAIGSSEG